MKIGVKLRPSHTKSDEDPGHMTVHWDDKEKHLKFRGFRFYPEDLPIQYQSSSMWRAYFITRKQTAPDYIFKDIIAQDDYEERPDTLIGKSWEIKDELFADLETAVQIKTKRRHRRHGIYSFTPDEFEDCHNCVTWATDIINKFVEGKPLESVENGRVKLMKEQLEKLVNKP